MVMRIVRALCSVLAAMGLYACDAVGLKELKPGVSTGFDVRERMGPPTMEWKNEDGSVVWEFARGPEGTQTWMMTIGADNILREIRQVLTEEYFARIAAGMTRDQVRRLLGRPGTTEFFPLKHEEVWSWLVDRSSIHRAYFNVHFSEAGTVTTTSRSRQDFP